MSIELNNKLPAEISRKIENFRSFLSSTKNKIEKVLNKKKTIDEVKSNVKATIGAVMGTSLVSAIFAGLHKNGPDLYNLFNGLDTLTNKEYSVLFFGNLYGVLYVFTPKRIRKTHHLVSAMSFGGFAITNWGLFISNIHEMSSYGYMMAACWGTATLAVNEVERRKLKKGLVTPTKSEIAETEDKIRIVLQRAYAEEEDKAVVVYIYDEETGIEKPVYWSHEMVNLTGRSLERTLELYKEGVDPIVLQYGHDPDNLALVQNKLSEAKKTGASYDNFVCEIRKEDGTLQDVAWTTKIYNDLGARITFGTSNYLEIQKVMKMDDSLPCIKKKFFLDDMVGCIVNRIENLGDAKKTLTLAVIDIDDFKNINERFGHIIGDLVLYEFVAFINHNLRDRDDIYRLGGDEFAIIYDTASTDQIIDKINKLKIEFSSMILEVEGTRVANRIKLISPEEASRYYQVKNLEGEGIHTKHGKKSTFMLPPISISIGLKNLDYKDIKIPGENSSEELGQIKERVSEFFAETDSNLIIGKHAHFLDIHLYVNALKKKGLTINNEEEAFIKAEEKIIKESRICLKTFGKKGVLCSDTSDGQLELKISDSKHILQKEIIEIISRRKTKLYSET